MADKACDCPPCPKGCKPCDTPCPCSGSGASTEVRMLGTIVPPPPGTRVAGTLLSSELLRPAARGEGVRRVSNSELRSVPELDVIETGRRVTRELLDSDKKRAEVEAAAAAVKLVEDK